MSTYQVTSKNKKTGKVVKGWAIDDYFGQHIYGYRMDDAKRVMRRAIFIEKYDPVEVTGKGTEETIAFGKSLEAVEEVTPDDPRDSEFLLTDGCMWEQNKKGGTFHPHAIEVVDVKTGQLRFINSGSTIKFVDGSISNGRDQTSYNKQPKQ